MNAFFHTQRAHATSVCSNDAIRYIPAISCSGHARRIQNTGTDTTLNRDDDQISTDKPIRVLVIDDDDVDRDRIGRFIKKSKRPFTVVAAASGRSALAILRDASIDLVIVDYHLGDMTGTELLSDWNKFNINAVPVIMVTGKGDEDTAIEAMKFGVTDYLPKKTLTPESLISAITSALTAAELTRKLRDTQELLRHLSLYDALTRLPNRNLFFDRLNQIIHACDRNHGSFTVLMIDLNLFKEINDSLGHRAGDEVLKTIGDRLQATARKSDTYARIGGDEFAAILQDVHKLEHAIACAEKIDATISKAIVIEGQVVQVGASIGIARYPEDGLDQTTLMSNADFAMYQAKKASRKYQVYNPKEETAVSAKAHISQYLRKAIKENEIYMEYQLKINLDTREVIGAEALARWNSPELGIVVPSNFIPMAERSSLIEDLTYTTIELALAQFVKWRNHGHIIPLAINISARMLDDQHIKDWLLGKLASYGIDHNYITLEITETALATSGHAAYQLLEDFSNAGLAISIDDFGSGYTSFSSIRNVNIAELKIDRLFIEKITTGSKDSAIVRSILSLAESLGMRVVAEGLESPEQWALLQKLGCQFAQGFGIARPMSPNAVIQWIEGKSTPNA
ncbi:MAG: EAL domain-containing protein [Gammaproteobacteria bacterium]|nr:EAL domain-containing protein [Gammaproteobacteria bacterium]